MTHEHHTTPIDIKVTARIAGEGRRRATFMTEVHIDAAHAERAPQLSDDASG